MQKEYLEFTELKSVDHIDGYDDFVFINREGKVFNQGTVNAAIRRMVRIIDLDILEKAKDKEPEVLIPNFSCHILRHTFATRLCEKAVNIKVIQAILGHSDFQTTMNIYVDVTNSLKKEELNKFDEYINADKRKIS
jgi:Site-specific recombinase XerD